MQFKLGEVVKFQKVSCSLVLVVINRPSVPGPVLQTPPLTIMPVGQLSFSSRSSKHHNSQTARARELKFWDNIHPPPRLTVMCRVSGVFFLLLFLQSFWASCWRVCYQLAYPVHKCVSVNMTGKPVGNSFSWLFGLKEFQAVKCVSML